MQDRTATAEHRPMPRQVRSLPPENDPAAEIGLWWPGARIWYGRMTGSWWAFLPGHPDRLLDFLDPAELIRAVAHLRKDPSFTHR